MLKKRIMTAAILIPLVLGAILYLPAIGFVIGSALVLMLACWEWSNLSGIRSFTGRFFYLSLLLALFLITSVIPPQWSHGILLLASIGWLFIAPLLMIKFLKLSCFYKASIGLFIFVACWQGLIAVHKCGPFYLLLLLVMVWVIDSAAYFIGKAWGKHKLAVKISPNKTLEGAIAGVIFSLIFGFFVTWIFPELLLLHHRYAVIGLLVFLTAIASITGDLFESMMKRLAGVKDSGQLVYGHGGVLDRMDSLISAAPIFAFGLIFFS